MSLTSILAEDRRLAILLTLMEASGYELNEDALKQVLRLLAHVVTQDVLRGDLSWLSEQGLVRVEKIPVTSGELWIAHLTGNGQDVANGAPYPGIARPRAR
jgi:hypothetical protein